MNTLVSSTILVAVLAVGSAAPAGTPGQPPPVPAPVDIESLGPKVGATVPDFTLQDQQGNTRTLSSLMGPRGAVLVFFRSADW